MNIPIRVQTVLFGAVLRNSCEAAVLNAERAYSNAESLLAGVATLQYMLQNLSEAAMARMVPTVAWAPLVSLAPACLPDQSCALPCAGEASTEAEYQARREAVIVSCYTLCC